MEIREEIKLYNSISKIYDRLLIIPDTNVLLYLYRCSSNASQKIVQVLEMLKEKTIIPNQVYMEYLEHKDAEQSKIKKKYENYEKELIKIVDKFESDLSMRIAVAKKNLYPKSNLLDKTIEPNVGLIRKEIDNYFQKYRNEKDKFDDQIERIENLVKYYEENKKISDEISMDLKLKYISEGELRYKYKMPPGYEDEQKFKENDRNPKTNNFQYKIKKFGDLFVWKEIIDIGLQNQEKCIFFLTNDTKGDWWELKDNDEPIIMRKELSKEFRDATGSDKIAFMELLKFYKVFSKHFEIQDQRTEIELNVKAYVENNITEKYKEEITLKIESYVRNIDFSDIDDEFAISEDQKCSINNLDIIDSLVYFEGNNAFYRIEYGADVELEFFTKDKDGDEILLGKVDVLVVFELVVERDIAQEEADNPKFNLINYNIENVVSPYDLYYD